MEGEEKEDTLYRIEENGGRILEVKEDAVIAEIHGDHERIENVVNELGEDVLEEVVRSGQVYISRQFGE